MNAVQRWAAVLGAIILLVYYSAQNGWLGPYGAPSDMLHQILLTSVLFFTYLAFVTALYIRGESEE